MTPRHRQVFADEREFPDTRLVSIAFAPSHALRLSALTVDRKQQKITAEVGFSSQATVPFMR
jgi:hypothetical protein